MAEPKEVKAADHPDLIGGIIWAPCELDWINAYGKRCHYDAMRDVFPAAHRLALELECLLLECRDTAKVSKWWESAFEALEQWREFCRDDDKPHNDQGERLPR